VSVYAFDFFNTLDGSDPELHVKVRGLARTLFALRSEVHIVSAISPGLPMDYEGMLKELYVPFTQIHRVDHDPVLKVEVLRKIKAVGFWDDLLANVEAARAAGISACHVGVDPVLQTRVGPCVNLFTHLHLAL